MFKGLLSLGGCSILILTYFRNFKFQEFLLVLSLLVKNLPNMFQNISNIFLYVIFGFVLFCGKFWNSENWIVYTDKNNSWYL